MGAAYPVECYAASICLILAFPIASGSTQASTAPGSVRTLRSITAGRRPGEHFFLTRMKGLTARCHGDRVCQPLEPFHASLLPPGDLSQLLMLRVRCPMPHRCPRCRASIYVCYACCFCARSFSCALGGNSITIQVSATVDFPFIPSNRCPCGDCCCCCCCCCRCCRCRCCCCCWGGVGYGRGCHYSRFSPLFFRICEESLKAQSSVGRATTQSLGTAAADKTGGPLRRWRLGLRTVAGSLRELDNLRWACYTQSTPRRLFFCC